MAATIYLIPTTLAENALQTIPYYVVDKIKTCDVFFVENEKTTRRYFKQLWKEMIIDNYEWFTIHKAEEEVANIFIRCIQQGKTIGIVSEAGCPCVADPGQILVALAHTHKAQVVPLVGPSSILLALMASGLNGQSFQFVGYLPIDNEERRRRLKEIEIYSQKNNCTQIFIETPYRNNQLLNAITSVCHSQTKLCIAKDISSANEKITTLSIAQWKATTIDLNKKPTIFLLLTNG